MFVSRNGESVLSVTPDGRAHGLGRNGPRFRGIRRGRVAWRRWCQKQQLAVPTVDGSKLGVADANRIFQHRVEYQLQFGGRAGYDAQHLRGRSLLLQRSATWSWALPTRGSGLQVVSPDQRMRHARGQRAFPPSFWSNEGCDRSFGSSPPCETRSPRRHSRCPFLPAHSQGSGLSIPTEPHDELAPFHSITSSARASSVGGTSRPSALAVLRLITNSNLTGF